MSRPPTPFVDVYVRVRGAEPTVLRRFLDGYVTDDQSEPRFGALVRTYVLRAPDPGDAAALADLRFDPSVGRGFSIYLRARHHAEAVVTLTEDDDLVLGLSLGDAPDVEERAAALLHALLAEFDAEDGICGTELAPPRSEVEWGETLAHLRVGRPGPPRNSVDAAPPAP